MLMTKQLTHLKLRTIWNIVHGTELTITHFNYFIANDFFFKDFLGKLMKGDTPSQRNKWFLYGTQQETDQLKHMSGYGPLSSDDDVINTSCFYFHSLCQRVHPAKFSNFQILPRFYLSHLTSKPCKKTTNTFTIDGRNIFIFYFYLFIIIQVDLPQ